MDELEALRRENECLKKQIGQYGDRLDKPQRKYEEAEKEREHYHSLYRETRAEADALKFAISTIFGEKA